MHDLRDRKDIDILLKAFYERVMADPRIGYLFTQVVHLDLETHLPRIGDFWETVLFSVPRYKGTPLEAHAELNRLSPLRQEHFARWLEVFDETMNEHFAGPVAETAKQRARTIAFILQSHIERIPPSGKEG